MMRRAVWSIALVAACNPVSLDSFLYAARPGDYELKRDVIADFRELKVKAPDGETLEAVFVPSSGGRADVTLLYCHGNNTNIGTAWERIEYLYPLGYNLMVFDYRGYGRATGTPTEPGLRMDTRAVREALLAQAGVDPDRLVYYGRSLGGATCIDLASTHPPAVLVTESTFASVAEFIRDGSYFDLPRSFVAESVWDSIGKIASIESPYLALHGAADDFVQPKYSVELTAAHPGTDELVLVPGSDHGDVPEKLGLDAYRRTVDEFVSAVLPPPSP